MTIHASSQQPSFFSPIATADAELPNAPDPGMQAPGTSAPSDQAASGNIHGIVSDHDGTVYQGVHVALSFTSSSITPPSTTITDSNGDFAFTGLPAGSFKLTVSSEGFATQTVKGLLLPGETIDLPTIVLPFATATTEVSVTASQTEVAEAQLKDEERQRVFGVLPNFYVVYAPNAPPLNSRQKFRLALRSSIDPITFLGTGFFAGIEQASDDFHGYGQGSEGYAKRFAANYADNFIGTMLTAAILPSVFKQDPRYFYKGTGSTRSRILYAIANSVICKSDKGRWQPNYSVLIGGLAAGGISNLYYPASDRDGVSLTFENAGFNLLEGAAQNIIQELLIKKLTPRVPAYNSSKP